jgi:hypothetical protein
VPAPAATATTPIAAAPEAITRSQPAPVSPDQATQAHSKAPSNQLEHQPATPESSKQTTRAPSMADLHKPESPTPMSPNSTDNYDSRDVHTPTSNSPTPGPTNDTANKHLAHTSTTHAVNQHKQLAVTTAATVPRVPPRKTSRKRSTAKHKLLPYGAPTKGTTHKHRRKKKRKPPQCPKRHGLQINQQGTAKPETDGHFNNSKEGEHNKKITPHRKKHGEDVAHACKGVLIPHSGLVSPGTVSVIQTGLRLQPVTVGVPPGLHARRAWLLQQLSHPLSFHTLH